MCPQAKGTSQSPTHCSRHRASSTVRQEQWSSCAGRNATSNCSLFSGNSGKNEGRCQSGKGCTRICWRICKTRSNDRLYRRKGASKIYWTEHLPCSTDLHGIPQKCMHFSERCHLPWDTWWVSSTCFADCLSCWEMIAGKLVGSFVLQCGNSTRRYCLNRCHMFCKWFFWG